MSRWDEDVPPEFEDVERSLRESRPEISPLELDQIKLKARSRLSASQPKGRALRSRIVVALATLGLLVGGTGGVIARSHGGDGNGGNGGDNQGDNEQGAANEQYCDNHGHDSECQQKSDKGDHDRGGDDHGGGD